MVYCVIWSTIVSQVGEAATVVHLQVGAATTACSWSSGGVRVEAATMACWLKFEEAATMAAMEKAAMEKPWVVVDCFIWVDVRGDCYCEIGV
ncbi:hypothetical protein OWV82_008770 [Melia azedarach]|uniref:Uncharacterized protein n=1 Tax=Melia azedarach TaxID=155640 RepID=A0ACC1YBD7_MELAZ|nr:hypothetical protein OWV82_008770 [Melia azedarach]